MASSKTIIPCLAAVVLISMISFSESKEFPVGSREGLWQVPPSPDYFNRWAERSRFRVGDYLVLKYDGKADSVLEVTEEGYKTCNKSNPIKSYDDGDTRFVFHRSGPFFFVSGADGHCNKGQKLHVIVMSPNHNSQSPAALPPSPSMNHHHAPAPAPAPAPKNGGSALKMGFLGGFAVTGILALF